MLTATPIQDEHRVPYCSNLLAEEGDLLSSPGRCWAFPEGPSTQHLRTLVPNAIKGMGFGTRVLKYWVLGPSVVS